MLIKAGINPSSLNDRGLSALDQCLIEMAPLSGSEIDEWIEIAAFLSKRIVSRTPYTIKLLRLQQDQRVSQQLLKLIASPPLLLTTCLHSQRRSNIPALLESRFLVSFRQSVTRAYPHFIFFLIFYFRSARPTGDQMTRSSSTHHLLKKSTENNESGGAGTRSRIGTCLRAH